MAYISRTKENITNMYINEQKMVNVIKNKYEK